jgi:hypothetical protein
VLRGQRREREREEHGVRELQIDSDIDDVWRRIVGFEERRGRTSGTKCEWNAFVRFQFDTNFEDDDEGETVALETTSVTARITQKWVRSW